MRLLVARPEPAGFGGGPDLGVMLRWMAADGHAVQALAAGGVDAEFAAHVDGVIAAFRPDVVLAYGAAPAGLAALDRARAVDVATVLMLWGEAPDHAFEHVDRVLVPSEWLRMWLRAAYGVVADVLPAALAGYAPAEADARGFLGFVEAAPEQGAAVFARVAATLAAARPDIPMLVVQGEADLAALTASLGEAALAQVMVSPALEDAALFSLVRVLLMPTAVADGCGALATQAGRQGVPVVASDRGALAEMVGAGGVVLPLPAVVLEDARLVPGEAETARWVAAVERLWDDEAAFGAAAAAGRALAARHDPAVLRERYVTFFCESYG